MKIREILMFSIHEGFPRRILVGGPHNVLAARCRRKDWLHPPEPDDLEYEGFWCQPL
jgi:hypothetical protein